MTQHILSASVLLELGMFKTWLTLPTSSTLNDDKLGAHQKTIPLYRGKITKNAYDFVFSV